MPPAHKYAGDTVVVMSTVILSAVKTQIPLTQQFRVQTTETLAETDTLCEMGFGRGKERYEVSATSALIVDRESFGTGRTTDIDNLAERSFKVDETPVPIAKDRADDKRTFARFAFQLEREARMTFKRFCVRQNRMPLGAVALGNHFSRLCILNRDDLTFLRLMSAQK